MPPIPPPQIAAQGTGANLFVIITPGIVSALVNVLDVNSLLPPSPTQTCVAGVSFATLAVKHTGNYTIAGTLGPNGSPTFCPGDELVAQVYGFDYDDMPLGPPGTSRSAQRCRSRPTFSVSVPGVYPTPPSGGGSGELRMRSSASRVSAKKTF